MTLWWLTWWLTWRWTWWLIDLKLTQLAHLLRFCKSISPSSSMNLSPTLLPLQGGWAHKRRACTSVWLDDPSNNQNSEIFEKCSTLDDYFLHVVDTSNRVCGLAHISPSISVCHLKFESDCCICIKDVIDDTDKMMLGYLGEIEKTQNRIIGSHVLTVQVPVVKILIKLPDGQMWTL